MTLGPILGCLVLAFIVAAVAYCIVKF